MKNVTDALRNVGHGVPDSQLVLTLLGGLNERLINTADDIANSTASLPTFARVHDMLVLKELRLANQDKVAVGTTLVPAYGASG